MKTNIIRTLLTCAFLIGVLTMNAQTKIYVHKTDGTSTEFNIADIDSISFTPSAVVDVDYTQLVLTEVSGNNKFVEIYNKGANAIPMKNVKLSRNDDMSFWKGSDDDIIPAGAYRIFLFNSYTPADLNTNPAYVGWTVGSGISSGQTLKVAIVDPDDNEVSVFIRGDETVMLPWQTTAGVTQNTTDTYSLMSDGTWAYAAPTPGAANGTKTSDIASPGYLTATPVDYSKLVLNEISGEHKFVEIYNGGTEALSLNGVKLQRNDGPASGGSAWVGTKADVIPAGAYGLFLFNNTTVASDNPAKIGTVSSGISDQQILKVALVDPSGKEFSVFIRGDVPLPAWQDTMGVSRDREHSYSRMSDGTWAYADPTPGAENGEKQAEILDPGYLTSQPKSDAY